MKWKTCVLVSHVTVFGKCGTHRNSENEGSYYSNTPFPYKMYSKNNTIHSEPHMCAHTHI